MESLSQAQWECDYRLTFMPKRRTKVIYEKVQQEESRFLDGHLMSDHGHMLVETLPKWAVSQVVGFIEETRAIILARVIWRAKANLVGQSNWAHSCSMGTLGGGEPKIRAYIRNQEEEGGRLEKLEHCR